MGGSNECTFLGALSRSKVNARARRGKRVMRVFLFLGLFLGLK